MKLNAFLILLAIIAISFLSYLWHIVDAVASESTIENLWYQRDTTVRNDTTFIYMETFDPYELGYQSGKEMRDHILKYSRNKELPKGFENTVVENGKITCLKAVTHIWDNDSPYRTLRPWEPRRSHN